MKFFEIAGGLRLGVDEEEQDILDYFQDGDLLDPDDLGERENEVCRKMVSKGLLIRQRHNNKIYYRTNGLEDSWRI